jgi:hypothetical protein
MSLMIGIPCYGGQVFADFAQSLIKLTTVLNKAELNHEIVFLGSESLISRGRNSIVSKFYSQPKFTHLLFLDADIIFNPECILKMISEDKEIIGCPYPKKQLNWNKLLNDSQTPQTIDKNLYYYSDINYNLLQKGTLKDTILEVKDIPTGCMMIKRSLITALMMAHPDRKYINNIAGMSENNMNNFFYDLFGCGVVDGIYLSEDYYFCHLVRQLGVKLYLETGYTFGHIGKQTFYGNLYAQIQKYGFEDKLNLDKICLDNNVSAQK